MAGPRSPRMLPAPPATEDIDGLNDSRWSCQLRGSSAAGTWNQTHRSTACHLSPCWCTATWAALVSERRVVVRIPRPQLGRPCVPSHTSAWAAQGAGWGPGWPFFAELRDGSGPVIGRSIRARQTCVCWRSSGWDWQALSAAAAAGAKTTSRGDES